MLAKIAPSRNIFILGHWLLVLIVLIALGLGWYQQYLPPDDPQRNLLSDLHLTFGLLSAVLIIFQLSLLILFRPLSYRGEIPTGQKFFSTALYLLIYGLITFILISGYLQAAFGVAPARLWGHPLPVWGAVDAAVAAVFGAAHMIAGLVLVLLILPHAGLGAVNLVKGRAAAAPPAAPEEEGPPVEEAEVSAAPIEADATPAVPEPQDLQVSPGLGLQASVPPEPEPVIVPALADGLARNLRLCGWIAFGIEVLIGLIAALLLSFATSGRAFSPGVRGFTDAIYWSGYAFMLLCLAIVLAFYYTRAARRILAKPIAYLQPENKFGNWFLWLGLTTNTLGVLLSFIGVALSIALLVVKTISQPPGIAITDPANIIRALDVFVLIINFILLIGHFVGLVLTLWLGIHASRARLGYLGYIALQRKTLKPQL
jgi:cytochrome b561